MVHKFELAHIDPGPPGQPQSVTVNTTAVTIILAVITILPPIITAVIDGLTKTDAAAVQLTQQRELRRVELLRAALAIENDEKRTAMVNFLAQGGLIDNVSKLSASVPVPYLRESVKQGDQDELKRQEREAEWLRTALGVKDDTARKNLVTFLVDAGLVRDPAGRLAKAAATSVPSMPMPVAPKLDDKRTSTDNKKGI